MTFDNCKLGLHKVTTKTVGKRGGEGIKGNFPLKGGEGKKGEGKGPS